MGGGHKLASGATIVLFDQPVNQLDRRSDVTRAIIQHPVRNHAFVEARDIEVVAHACLQLRELVLTQAARLAA